MTGGPLDGASPAERERILQQAYREIEETREKAVSLKDSLQSWIDLVDHIRPKAKQPDDPAP